jgi:AraC-like DNA-binding protein
MRDSLPSARRIELSTREIGERDRLAFWADVVCSQLIRAEVDPLGQGGRGDGFHGTLARVHTAGMDICSIRAAGQKVVRTPRLLRALDEPMCVVALQVAGVGRISQNDRTAVLQPGDMTLFSNARPYELLFEGSFEQRVFIVPQALVQGVIGDVDVVAALPLSGAHPGNRLLGAYAEALSDAPGLPDTQASQFREGMLQTLSAVLGGAGIIEGPGVSRLRRYHLARIHAFIRDNLADTTLGIDAISAALQLSPQHIHRLFVGQERTLSATIWHLRLDACRCDLSRPELCHLSIGDIGYRWGFVDQAHFSRRFRQQFGVSPRECRMAAVPALVVRAKRQSF